MDNWDPNLGMPMIRTEDDSFVDANGGSRGEDELLSFSQHAANHLAAKAGSDAFNTWNTSGGRDTVFWTVPQESGAATLPQANLKNPLSRAAARKAERQAAKALKQAARQAARKGAAPETVEMTRFDPDTMETYDLEEKASEPVQPVEQPVEPVVEPLQPGGTSEALPPVEVIRMDEPLSGRFDELLTEFKETVYGKEGLSGEAAVNQMKFLQESQEWALADAEPESALEFLIDRERIRQGGQPVHSYVHRDPWGDEGFQDTLNTETVVGDLQPLSAKRAAYAEWVRAKQGGKSFAAQEAEAKLAAVEPPTYGPNDWADTVMETWEFWDSDPEEAVDKMMDDVHVDMEKTGRSQNEALDNLRELTTPKDATTFNEMSSRVGQWRNAVHTQPKSIEMSDLDRVTTPEVEEIMEMDNEFSMHYNPADLEMVQLDMGAYGSSKFGSLAARDSWATGQLKGLVSEYGGKMSTWASSLPGKGVRQLLPGANIMDWKGKVASRVDKFFGVSSNKSGTKTGTGGTGGSTEVEMQTLDHGGHDMNGNPYSGDPEPGGDAEFGLPEEKMSAVQHLGETEVADFSSEEVLANLNYIGEEFPQAMPLKRFVGVSATTGEAMLNVGGLREWLTKQAKGLLAAPLLVPLSMQMDKVMPGGSTWFNLGLSMIDVMVSGDPLGLAVVGTMKMLSAQAAADARRQDNLDPQKERGKKYGYVRVGDTWYPAFSDTDFKGEGWFDSSNATALQYGENMIWKRVFVGGREQSRLQPFFEEDDRHYKIFEMSDAEFKNQAIAGQKYNFETEDEVRYGGKAQIDNWDPMRNWYLLSGDDVNKMMNGIASGDVHATDSFKVWHQEKGKTTTGKDMNPYEKQMDDWRRVVELMHDDPTLTEDENLDLATFDITGELRNAAWQGNQGHDAAYGKRNALFGPGYQDVGHKELKWDTGFENATTDDAYYDVMTSDNDFNRWSQPENKWLLQSLMQDQVQALLDAQRYAAEEQGFK